LFILNSNVTRYSSNIVRLSVCMSVCLSVTIRYCIETA